MTTDDKHMVLSGIVGSTAYGLAGPDSDVDRLGLFAWPTAKVLGLGKPQDSLVTRKPDRTLHEIGKWCGLAINCNPTAMEIVWLPDDLYEERTILGDELIGIRSAFLSARRVKDAYLGYATQQLVRLEGRALSSETIGQQTPENHKKRAKHARHILRLLNQGWLLYTTGELHLRLEEPEIYFAFGERVADGDIRTARKEISVYERAFAETKPVLSEAPDKPLIEEWLVKVRRHLF